MIITQGLVDRITRKNGRARKRMAARYMRKAFAYNCREIGNVAAASKKFTPVELELNEIIDRWSAKTMRRHARRRKDIDKSISKRFPRFTWPSPLKF